MGNLKRAAVIEQKAWRSYMPCHVLSPNSDRDSGMKPWNHQEVLIWYAFLVWDRDKRETSFWGWGEWQKTLPGNSPNLEVLLSYPIRICNTEPLKWKPPNFASLSVFIPKMAHAYIQFFLCQTVAILYSLFTQTQLVHQQDFLIVPPELLTLTSSINIASYLS